MCTYNGRNRVEAERASQRPEVPLGLAEALHDGHAVLDGKLSWHPGEDGYDGVNGLHRW